MNNMTGGDIMSDLFDEAVDLEILGGLEYSDEEKDKMTKQAYELGLDLNDYNSWEEIQAAIDGLQDEL
jgi:hypothetical protein